MLIDSFRTVVKEMARTTHEQELYRHIISKKRNEKAFFRWELQRAKSFSILIRDELGFEPPDLSLLEHFSRIPVMLLKSVYGLLFAIE